MSQSRINSMEMKGEEIHKAHLKVGQWVKFITEENSTDLSKLQQEIYHKDQVFLVLSRSNDGYSEGHLIDNKGKIYNYHPPKYVGYALMIPGQKITAFSSNIIEDIYGMEKMLKIYEASQPFLKKMSIFFNQFGYDVLDVNTKIQQIKKKMLSDRYAHGAVAGALEEKLPFDFSVLNIGPFLTRKEGMYLAQTCKAARDGANNEEQSREEAMEKKMKR
jgi:hypothetical protein